MERLNLLLFLSGLLTAAFPRYGADPQILTPQIDQPTPQDPPFFEAYPEEGSSSNFQLPSIFPAPDAIIISHKNDPTILNPEPNIDTTYCTERKVLVCCPQQITEKYKIPDDGFLSPDCRLAAQYGVEFGKYPCRCCGGFFNFGNALQGTPFGSNCVDDANYAEGYTGGTLDGGREESEGAWY